MQTCCISPISRVSALSVAAFTHWANSGVFAIIVFVIPNTSRLYRRLILADVERVRCQASKFKMRQDRNHSFLLDSSHPDMFLICSHSEDKHDRSRTIPEARLDGR